MCKFVISCYWLCSMGRYLGVAYEMGQSLATNMKQTYMVLVTRSSSGVQLQVISDVQWSLK